MTTATAATEKIRDLFLTDVTRDIPPVIYFHEQDPEKLQDEVSEYIITGGYPEDHPHHTRVPMGIHEQFVRLLSRIAAAIENPSGSEPAAWISGFYGSGKSSFAKLLGLALDGKVLPDGRTMAEALLARDTSPKASEFHAAWEKLASKVDSIAVVFDIGGVARDNEHIHAAVVRQVQKRLGYCSSEPLVADFELKLERDGKWQEFLATCEEVLGEPWDDLKDNAMAEDDFSEVLHEMYPERYEAPTSWIESRAGFDTQGISANEATKAIADMMEHRAPGKTLFLVVDEVSQYIHQDQQRMLKLQSFASALSAQLKGRAWLLVTGQEKLEDESEATVLGKLQGRFPPHLRVHLDATNIRDVVHKRLLQKKPSADPELRDLFNRYRSNLQLFAHDCDHITVEDFVEVYPMLPGHIDLLMEITSAMRTRSTRVQGDTHAIRGLIQLLGELFREKNLADREVGRLVTFDDIYDVQSSALDTDTQNTMAKIHKWCSEQDDKVALRVAKVVALLQLIQDTEPTTVEFVAQCLYDRLDRGDNKQEVEDALERLRENNLVTHSPKNGYKLQSNAGQEWVQERERIEISYDQASEFVRDQLKLMLDAPNRPRHHGTPFPFSAWFTDSRGARDVQLKSARNQATVPLDFRFIGTDDRSSMTWIQRSEQDHLSDRVIWVVGQAQEVIDAARAWGRSKTVIRKNNARRANLKAEKFRLLMEEKSRAESLERKLKDAIEAAWMSGKIYFRGREIDPREKGSAFNTALHNVGNELLPSLYPNFTPLSVTETELEQLLSESLAGASTKFMEDELGILSMDAGTHVVSCSGKIPSQILRSIEKADGVGGGTLFSEFTDQPYGYHSSVVRACLAGLLRAKKIVIQAESGSRITSYRDPGTQDLFRRERDLKRASIFPAGEDGISPRERIRICKFFKKRLQVDVDREDEAIADAVYDHFPRLRNQLKHVKERLYRLPDSRELPDELVELETSLDSCLSSRRIEETVESVKRNLDSLQDGVQQLRMYRAELTDDKIADVRRVSDVIRYQYKQLVDVGLTSDDVKDAAETITKQLDSKRPWRQVDGLAEPVEVICDAYTEARQELIDERVKLADEARDRVKSRDGFSDLDRDGSHHVLRPISDAFSETDAEAIAPTLAALRAEIQVRLPQAVEEAHDRLDKLLEPKTPIVKVRHGVSNQTIKNEDELELLLKRLEKRVKEQLKNGHHVRLF